MSRTTSGHFDLSDGTLYYETAGEGKTLVLSHAGFLDSRMFDPIWEELAQRFHVIRYDMRGFGQSSEAHGPLCRRNDLFRLLEYLKVTRAHLIGCSQGGEIMLDLTLEQPTLVDSLILVDSTPSGFQVQGEPPRYMPEMIEAVQQGDVNRASELQIRIWLDGMFREPDQVNSALREKALAMNHISVAQNTFLIADMQPINALNPPALTRLPEISCPTLIVVGALDHPEVLRGAKIMTEGIPNAREAVIEATAHVPSFERPDEFLKLALEFLQGL